MNTITLFDAVFWLKQSRGILLEGRFIEPYVFGVEGEYNNIFMTLEWEELVDNIGVLVTVHFKEGDNQTVGVSEGVLLFINSDGEEEEIILIKEWNPFE
jgi:hypothetical protein